MQSRRRFLRQLSGLAGATALGAASGSPAAARASEGQIEELSRALADGALGQIVKPGEPGHDKIKYYNGRFDCVRSTTYIRPASAEGVQKIVEWASRHRLPLGVRGAGHSFEGRSSNASLVIDVSQLKRLTLETDGTLRVDAGVLLGDVYKTLNAASRILPAGTCPTVGIVGHALGGGIGDFLPMYGYAAQSLIDVTLVTMSGMTLKVSDDAIEVVSGPKLTVDVTAPAFMKVLRGGGQGSLGVVTSMSFRTHDVSNTKLASFRLESGDVPIARSIAIITAWQKWRETLPRPMHALVSSKMDLNRSGSSCSFAIAGLIAIPAGSDVKVADIRKTLDVFFQMPELSKQKFAPSLDAAGAVKSFLDDDETTYNPKRKMLYGSSSALPAALPKPAVEFLINNLKSSVNASFYTSGGKVAEGPATSLHLSEFIVEWSTYSPKRDATAHRRIKTIRDGVSKAAKFEDRAFPNYPDDQARNYFADREQVARLAAMFDPNGISTSSLLTNGPADESKC